MPHLTCLIIYLQQAEAAKRRHAERAEKYVAPAEEAEPTIEEKRKKKRKEREGEAEGNAETGEGSKKKKKKKDKGDGED